MNKKIGIITFHNTTNFGSLLQAYGLYKTVESINNNVELIDYHCSAVEERECLTLNKNNIKSIIKFFFHFNKNHYFKKFIKKNFKLSKPYYSSKDIGANNDYDILISGSDILWGRDITNSDYTYFLDFASENQKKYSYASSLGDYHLWDGDQHVVELLNNFQIISVREENSKKWVENIVNKEVEFVCDPTMLISPNDWLRLFNLKQKYKDYFLVYFNNQDSKCISDSLKCANFEHKKVLFINYGKPRKGVKNIKPKTIEDFLSLIYYADGIFTSSYHGILFSLYFKKKLAFYTLKHKDRVLSLSHFLGVGDCCFDTKDFVGFFEIDYNDVHKRIDSFRKKSSEFLKRMVN